MGRYINPFIDFGFKYIFGRDESKPFLIDFLNELLREEPGFSPIVNLEYLDKEHSRMNEDLRGIIYDIHCETSDGRRFTVEMQNQSQQYFFDRIIYYGSKGVSDQGKPGRDWRYSYLPVYCVSFMNFIMESHPDQFRIDVGLCDLKTKELFSDKQRYIFIQTPLFDKKTPEECKNGLDEWMYNIINMPNMDSMAFTQKKSLFDKLDDMVTYASLSEEDRMAYDADVKAYRDMRGQLEFVEARGEARGEEKGKAEMIKELYKQGMATDFIAGVAKMTVDKVRHILGL